MIQEQWTQFKYFNPNEKWGNPEKMDFRLLWALDKLRADVGAPLIIHCGYETGGHSDNSYHYKGQAVDFHIGGKGRNFEQDSWDIGSMWFLGGMGSYPDWNNSGYHLDIGPRRDWRKETPLKPCPKCHKADNIVYSEGSAIEGEVFYWYYCCNCYTEGVTAATLKEAKRLWNLGSMRNGV